MNRIFKKPAIFALILLTISLLEYSSPVFGQEVSDQTQGVTDPFTTFLISLGIGVLGASSYLFILLMTDRNLSILENQILGTRVMATLFTLVGGIVAGVIQTSTGSGIPVTSIQNVFMLGFGWQGVMSGAGGSSKVGELKEFNTDFNELLNDLAPADTS